jgi:hypothetical protein
MLAQSLRGALAAIVVESVSGCASAPAQAPATRFVIASPSEGAAVLSARDDYFDALTPPDLSIRLQGAANASAADLGALYARSTLAWTPEETARLEAMLARRRGQLGELAEWLPERVLIVKGSDAIESGYPHTRGNAIYLGASLVEPDARLDGLFFHELFHVLSRNNPARHDEIYGIIGFSRCELDAPPELRARMMTNPDAPLVGHAAAIPESDPGFFVTPLLTANPTRYQADKPTLGDYFVVEFTALRQGSDGRCRPIDNNAGLTQDQLREAMLERVGRNTTYLFHPEEMMAVNFSQMMTGRAAADPWVHERLAALLGVERPPTQIQPPG